VEFQTSPNLTPLFADLSAQFNSPSSFTHLGCVLFCCVHNLFLTTAVVRVSPSFCRHILRLNPSNSNGDLLE
jgi:hypothetical protein